jgi:acetyl esterase/lipase
VLVLTGFASTVLQDSETPALPFLHDLKYGPSAANVLDLYYPTKGKPPFPVIVWIHGGAWHHGDKRPLTCPALLENGYAVASINYRLSTQAIFPAQIEDCKGAIIWLRQHAKEFNIDPNRIGVWGSSSGGHLAALLDTTSNGANVSWAKQDSAKMAAVQAVCDWSGPVDLLGIEHPGVAKLVTQFLGQPPQAVPELVKEANPATYADSADPPILIVHGDHDEQVPCSQSQELASVLTSKGIDCRLVMVPNGTHNLTGDNLDKSIRRTIDFFDRTLKANH